MGGKFKILERFVIIVIVIAVSALAVNALDDWRQREQDPCPEEMVFVPSPEGGFCIDKYENSPNNGCSYSFPMNSRDTLENMAGSDCRAVSLKDKRPWIYVSRDQAAELCRLNGKRLPTAAEWQSAALGTPDNIEANCNLNKNWAQRPGAGGQALNCVSAVGAYDMIGNVWEWVSDEVRDGFSQGQEIPASGYIQAMSQSGLPAATALEPDEMYGRDYLWHKDKGLKAVAKGGYYDSGSKGGRYSTYIEVGPEFTGAGVGFRCVE